MRVLAVVVVLFLCSFSSFSRCLLCVCTCGKKTFVRVYLDPFACLRVLVMQRKHLRADFLDTMNNSCSKQEPYLCLILVGFVC